MKEESYCDECGEVIKKGEEYASLIISVEKEDKEGEVDVLASKALLLYHKRCSPLVLREEKTLKKENKEFIEKEGKIERNRDRCPCCNKKMHKLKTGQWTHLFSEGLKEVSEVK